LNINNKNLKNIIINSGNLKKKEKCLIIFDNSTIRVALQFIRYLKINNYYNNYCKEKIGSSHGTKISSLCLRKMLNSNLVICLTKLSRAHTKARYLANKNGIRFLSLPQFSNKILRHKSCSINFKKNLPIANKIKNALDKSSKIKIISKKGTYLNLYINTRFANAHPGFVNDKILLASPPDSEVNICPIEDKSNGIICVDGSVTSENIGKVHSLIFLHIKKGKIFKVETKKKKYKQLLLNIFDNLKKNSKKIILSEFGVGLNKKAKLIGNMLIDEGAIKTIHFGFGSNFSLGGRVKINFHMDFICKDHTVILDGRTIILNGNIVL
jgi:leucyl aminopeptidase (aminopeptidase T)